ncbi:protein O-linked-mannose beta-1,4-N-acetylglucosaminyltransferase 2-like [Rhodnius prolixus]|uniref:protein O-linked-mannose beta-1,4-N-acetylglucosaminyltransferase 2-like n=1 Tax=Rhodnius prolixus TaxID=13249 RepID=UPI003D18B3C4
MSKFKPDNIMHVIHDDILPLYVTYKRICLGKVEKCSSETLIAFVDNPCDNYTQLYEAFTFEKPLILQTLKEVTCFSEVHVGLDSDSIFYQYGYKKPQGFVTPKINGEIVFEFTEYILKHLRIERNPVMTKSTFIGRLVNRKILNEKFLVELIKDLHFKNTGQTILVNNIDINAQPIEEVIVSVANSKLIIGMHGAGMMLAMFMPLGSIALELFPYGIVKEHVSALYSLSRVRDVHFGYLSWTNIKKENSLRHPEYPRLLGGFDGISDAEKIRITNASHVQAVHCCNDPLYLHFMYQDTYVDDTIIPIVLESFKNKKIIDSKKLMLESWYFPSQVRNIECYLNDNHLTVMWDPPINVGNLSGTYYKVFLSWPEQNSTYVTKSSLLRIDLSLKDKHLLVWILCVRNGIQGTDSYFMCRF